jgi:hypothetical protein
MKIRIKGNSIRMRLSKTEVDRFGTDGYVEERTDIGNNTFIYAVRKSDGDALSASFIGVKITMLVPAHIITEWVTTEKVGYSNTIDFGNGKQLSLLLEKDFQCIDAAVTEDQSDNYENPSLACAPGVAPAEATYEHPKETVAETPSFHEPETPAENITAVEENTGQSEGTEPSTWPI